jgi:hypothetical protein
LRAAIIAWENSLSSGRIPEASINSRLLRGRGRVIRNAQRSVQFLYYTPDLGFIQKKLLQRSFLCDCHFAASSPHYKRDFRHFYQGQTPAEAKYKIDTQPESSFAERNDP